MKWKLQDEQSTDTKRVYVQDITGTQITTELIYSDKMGANWWGFSNLFSIPYIRTAYSKSISDMFTAGLSTEDIKAWCKQEKALLKGNDPEKYEKLYSLVLEKEALTDNIANPLQLHLSLCTVYVLADKERIDYFDLAEATKKIDLWKLDPDATGFFLNWHTGHIQKLTKTLDSISLIASKQGNLQG